VGEAPFAGCLCGELDDLTKGTAQCLLVAFVAAAGTTPCAVRAFDPTWRAPAKDAKRKNPIRADAESIATGAALYKRQCAACHGATGAGDGPAVAELSRKPESLKDPELAKESDGEIFWKLTVGKKPMPSFVQWLSEDDRWHVINYVRTLARDGGK
jgi:mono/diheme cytochrome c family protein